MISVKIGTVERRLDAVDASWVNQQINRQRAEGGAVCVRVRIEAARILMSLATVGCASGGVGRPPREAERHVLDLWRRHRLDADGFTGGNLVSFLHDLERTL
ncbi:MAG: hypothetical protein ACR2JW_03385 [Thermomicrobiales bacterium]